jgi:hypothetical protein
MAARETGVRIEGLDRFVRTLKQAGDDLADMKAANERAGAIIADDASMRAPRRSGKLAGSIRPTKQAKRARVQAGRASLPYAGPIHWGWPARGIDPQPFLTDAAVATESRWLPQYLDDVQAALDNVKGA